MNFHSLDYFLVLAREKNFTRAAEALHITQQSLSSHIANLERELNCTLVVRRTPLELTYAGRTFLRYAESIGQTRQAMEREFCDISENQKGELRVGIAYTRGRAIMPHLIPAFQRRYPNVEITLLEGSNDAIQKALLSGGIDLAIAAFPRPLPGAVLEDYYLEHTVLCLSDGLLAQCGIDLDTHRDLDVPGAEIAHSFDEAAALGGDDAIVIGGASVYMALLSRCDRVYVTKVDADPDADSFFPNLDDNPDWRIESESETFEENGLKFRYVDYVRK